MYKQAKFFSDLLVIFLMCEAHCLPVCVPGSPSVFICVEVIREDKLAFPAMRQA